MEILFDNNDIQKLCTDKRLVQRRLGADAAKKLQARLMDLSAATVVADLTAGNPHPLKDNREGQFALNISGSKRLVFVSNHEPPLLDSDQKTDWSKVSKIKVIFIGDYHD